MHFPATLGLSLLLCSSFLYAQELQPAQEDLVPNQQVFDADPPYTPLTLKQNYLYAVHQMFDPGRLALVATRAGMDHSTRTPSGWDRGAEGYAERFASHLGRDIVRQNLAFGIRVFDHEDPRYFRSRGSGVLKRARYAMSRTVIARNEHGGNMPAYSTVVSAFATPLIAQAWRPEHLTAGRELRSGSTSLGFAAAGNLCQEFWPDLRKTLFH